MGRPRTQRGDPSTNEDTALLKEIVWRGEQFYFWEVCSVACAVTRQQRETFYGCMGSDIEVWKRCVANSASPPIREIALPGQEACLPRKWRPFIKTCGESRVQSFNGFVSD